MIRTLFKSTLGLLALLAAGTAALADESAPPCCGHPIVLAGDFKHVKTPAGVTVAGAENQADFAEEITGKAFTATVAGLEAGSYTIEVEAAEVSAKRAGAHVMDITAGETGLAKGLDVFKAAGGVAKAWRLTRKVEHPGDALRGPLTIEFTGRKGQALLAVLTIKNAAGAVVASIVAHDATNMTDPAARAIPVVTEPVIYTDPDQPVARRVADLIRRMSLQEKVSQLMDKAEGIDRLGVPGYNYWNECLHGVARNGVATVFPQATGMAAMWDAPLMHEIGDTIATEGRAKFAQVGYGVAHARYAGLTFWTPNINIFRDPRWGRGQETYGEDPVLTARLGVAFIQGLQGDNPTYLKAAACAKHFAVHSGPEATRNHFDAQPPERDLYETYLPQFEAAVREGKVEVVMGAYNRLDGVPCTANAFLLTTLLRTNWGFQGHVVSDCGAIHFIHATHKFAPTEEQAAADGIKAGCNLECGTTYSHLVQAVHEGLCSEADLDSALSRVLTTRFKLGLFDPTNRVPYAAIPPSENDTSAHRALALRAAEEGMVLLKNDGLLPLDRTKLHTVAVIGANADSARLLLGNYNGTPSASVTFLAGLKAALGEDVKVTVAAGCPLALHPGETFGPDAADFQAAVAAARTADVVIYIGGISAQLEGEEMKVNYDGFLGGDRTRIELPATQTQLLQALQATGRPVVFVNCSGGAMAFPWAAENLPAILQAWYPGEEGGTALAKILLGEVNPAGRLPVTFYRSTADLPAFESYAMANRTYRYFPGKPLFPFGHGLSYTHFAYGDLTVTDGPVSPSGTVRVSLPVTNSGTREGDEVVQLYVRHLDSKVPQPLHSLAAFRRIHLAANATATVTLEFPASTLRWWDVSTKSYVVEAGTYEIQVGASSADIRHTAKLQIGTN